MTLAVSLQHGNQHELSKMSDRGALWLKNLQWIGLPLSLLRRPTRPCRHARRRAGGPPSWTWSFALYSLCSRNSRFGATFVTPRFPHPLHLTLRFLLSHQSLNICHHYDSYIYIYIFFLSLLFGEHKLRKSRTFFRLLHCRDPKPRSRYH